MLCALRQNHAHVSIGDEQRDQNGRRAAMLWIGLFYDRFGKNLPEPVDRFRAEAQRLRRG
jgi:hypothetical protein